MSTNPNRSIVNRKLPEGQYEALFDRISLALFEVDPVGVNFESNTDEYDPEAGVIIMRLKDAASVQDVEMIIHEEFCCWFGLEVAGGIDRYRSVASRVWELWCEFNNLSA